MKFVEFAIVKPDHPEKVKRVAILTDDPEAVVRQFTTSGWQVLGYTEKEEADVAPQQMQLAKRNADIVRSGWTTGPESVKSASAIAITSVAATPVAPVSAGGASAPQSPAPGEELEAAVRHAAEAARQGVDVTVTFTKRDGPNEMRVTVNNTASRQTSFWVTIGAIAAGLIVVLAFLAKVGTFH